MKLTTIREIYKNREAYLDKEVTVGGWVRSVRDSKTFGFIVLHDGSYFETLQIVYHDEMENFAEISKMNVGAAIIVKGTLVATPQAKQPFEIQAAEITVEGVSAPDYPLQKKRHSMEYLRTISICVREPTPSRQYSVFVPSAPMRSISSSRRETSFMSTPR